MSLSVAVHKDIGEYREKVVGKLSLRTLLCVALGLAAAIAVAALCHWCLGIEVSDASLPVMCASVPFWLLGFWRPHGMPAERFVPLLWGHAFGPSEITYAPGYRVQGMAPARIAQKTTWSHRRRARRKGAEIGEPSKKTEER